MNKTALKKIVEKIKNDSEVLFDTQSEREESYIKSKNSKENRGEMI